MPGGGVCGPDTRLQSLGAKPFAVGLDLAAPLLDAGVKVEPRAEVRKVNHLPP